MLEVSLDLLRFDWLELLKPLMNAFYGFNENRKKWNLLNKIV